MNQQEVLQGPFSIEIHKRVFINYLEVIVSEEGIIMYATPSHQEKLIKIACKKLDITREELNKRCPVEYYYDFMTWLCLVSGCVALWNDQMVGKANKLQKQAIELLIAERLYRGPITGEI